MFETTRTHAFWLTSHALQSSWPCSLPLLPGSRCHREQRLRISQPLPRGLEILEAPGGCSTYFILQKLCVSDLPPSVFGYLLPSQLVKLLQTLWCRHVICSFQSCISLYLAIEWLNLPSSYLPVFSASYDVGRRHLANFLLTG